MLSYESAGVFIESEIELPGLRYPNNSGIKPDLTIRKGNTPTPPASLLSKDGTWAYDGCAAWVMVASVGVFYIQKTGNITVELLEKSTDREAAIYLIGSILGVALHLSGKIALHSSAVMVNDKAVLFCGTTGAGKSTIAAALEGRGYPILSDDLCTLDIVDNKVFVHSDGRLLKLWQASLEGLGLKDRRGDSVCSKPDKYFVQPLNTSPSRLRLSHVYFLHDSNSAGVIRIKLLTLTEAAAWFFANAYRPGLIKLLGQEADYLAAAATLATNTKVSRLTRTKNFSFLPVVIDNLEAHWSCENSSDILHSVTHGDID